MERFDETLFEDFLDDVKASDRQGKSALEITTDTMTDMTPEQLAEKYPVVLFIKFYTNESMINKFQDEYSEKIIQKLSDIFDVSGCISSFQFGSLCVCGTETDADYMTIDKYNPDTKGPMYISFVIGMDVFFNMRAFVKTFGSIYQIRTGMYGFVGSIIFSIFRNRKVSYLAPADHIYSLSKMNWQFDNRDRFFEGVSFKDAFRMITGFFPDMPQETIIKKLSGRYPEQNRLLSTSYYQQVIYNSLRSRGMQRVDTRKASLGKTFENTLMSHMLSSSDFDKAENTDFDFIRLDDGDEVFYTKKS